jgi:hypothetical protein
MLLWDSHFWLSAEPFWSGAVLFILLAPSFEGSLEGPPLSRLQPRPDVSDEAQPMTSVQPRTAISWPTLRAVHPRLVLSFVRSHQIAAVGTLPVAHARSNGFSLGVVLYEMRFDAPPGRVTD